MKLFSLFCYMLLCATAQAQPYGIEERIPNQSLIISLQDEEPPLTIAASGLYSDIATRTVAQGIIPFGVNAQLWSDGTYKERFIALPGTEKIRFSADSPWKFPPGSVLVKNFYLEFESGNAASRWLIETRFLVKDIAEGKWCGFSYKWEADGSDAVLLEREFTEVYFVLDSEAEGGIREHLHYFPNRKQCDQCHVRASGTILGLRTAQINRDHDYGGIVDNQLRTLNHIGLFTEDIGENYAALPRMADPFDESQILDRRARSYLAANCSHCHQPDVVSKANIDLRFATPLEEAGVVDRVPTLGTLDLEDPRILKPGDPDNSSLLNRLLVFDSNRMPPLATNLVDWQGADLLRRWIASLRQDTHVAGGEGQPDAFFLAQNYPNPFNPETVIGYRVSGEGSVELVVFAAAGQRIRTLVASHHTPGSYQVRWDGRDQAGTAAASGVYLYRLRAGDFQQQRRLTLLK